MTRLGIASLSLLCAASVAAGAASPAIAYQDYFCPGSGSMIWIRAGEKCVGGGKGNLVRVYATRESGQEGGHCAVGKERADGSGIDVIPRQCGSGTSQITGCYSARFGYPTISNYDSKGHYFSGSYDYITCFH